MTGMIHSVQTMGTVDGPGVRFVVFLQGCRLRCDYCHNPDTWKPEDGTTAESRELVNRANRYRNYYGRTPGITVTGGEPLLQQAFVTELFRECKALGFHTALDTAGSTAVCDDLLEVTDLCLLDVKYATDEEYKKYTGGSLVPVLNLLEALEKKRIETRIRHVVVPGRTDRAEQIRSLKKLLAGYRCISGIEFLPFRKLCLEKYEELNIPFRLKEVPEAGADTIRSVQEIWDE